MTGSDVLLRNKPHISTGLLSIIQKKKKLKMSFLNDLIDFLIPFYIFLIFIIIYKYKNNQQNKKLNLKFSYKNIFNEKNKKKNENEIEEINEKNEEIKENEKKIENWIEKFNGIWQQTEHENFDNFLIFSDTSYVIRKLAPLVFTSVYHTITIDLQKKTFHLLRDFGPGRKEFHMNFKIRNNEKDGDVIERITVDTGEEYSMKMWLNDEIKTLFILSTPIDKNKGIIITHSRTFVNDNKIKMVWDGYNLQTKTTCQMISYFERVQR